MILVGTGDAADAKRRLLERAGAVVVGEDANAALAIVARLKVRGVLVNAVDRVALCDFTLPAIVDRDPVLVAIGTGGASAGLAKALRQRLETLMPQTLGLLASALSNARRALRDKFPDAADRRKAIDAALSDGGALDPFGEGCDVSAWLVGAADTGASRTETFVLTSRDPDDLTLKQARLLGGSDQIYHAADVPAAHRNAPLRFDRRVSSPSIPSRGSSNRQPPPFSTAPVPMLSASLARRPRWQRRV